MEPATLFGSFFASQLSLGKGLCPLRPFAREAAIARGMVARETCRLKTLSSPCKTSAVMMSSADAGMVVTPKVVRRSRISVSTVIFTPLV